LVSISTDLLLPHELLSQSIKLRFDFLVKFHGILVDLEVELDDFLGHLLIHLVSILL
jgi:hypothetical protein